MGLRAAAAALLAWLLVFQCGGSGANAQELVQQDWSLVPPGVEAQCDMSSNCNSYILNRTCFLGGDGFTPSLTIDHTRTDVVYYGVILRMVSNFMTAALSSCAKHIFEAEGRIPAGATFQPVYVYVNETDPVSVMNGMLCLRRVGEEINVVIGPHSDNGIVSGLQQGKLFNMANFVSMITSSALDDSSAYTGFPMVARIGSRYSDMTKGQVQLLHALGVTKFASLSFGDGEIHRSIANGAREGAQEFGLQLVISEAIFPGSPRQTVVDTLMRIKASRVKFIVLMVDGNLLATDESVITEAYALDMFNGEFAWFGHIWPLFVSSTAGDQAQGLFLSLTGLDDQSPHMSNMTSCMLNMPDTDEFESMSWGGTDTLSPFAIIFDSAMTALHFAAEKYSRNIQKLSNDDFRSITSEIRFRGTTGTVAFNEHFERPHASLAFYNLRKIPSGAIVPVKVALLLDGELEYLSPPETFLYTNGRTPILRDYDMDCSVANAYDLVISECQPMRTVSKIQKVGDAQRYCPDLESYQVSCDHAAEAAVLGAITINVLGLLMTFGCMIFLIMYWRHPLVMSGQREWLLCMCCGALICQVGFPLGTIGELTTAKCIVALFSLSTGALLILGSLMVKLIRLRRVMLSKTFRRQKVGSSAFKVTVLISLNLAVLVVAETMSGSRTKVEHTEVFTDFGDQVSHQICARSNRWAEQTSTVMVGLLAIYCCGLANEARNLSSALSEGVFVFVAVYNATLTAVVVYLFASVTHDTTFIATVQATGLLLACSGTVVLLLFKRFYCILTFPKDTNWRNFIVATSGNTRGAATSVTTANTTSHTGSQRTGQ